MNSQVYRPYHISFPGTGSDPVRILTNLPGSDRRRIRNSVQKERGATYGQESVIDVLFSQYAKQTLFIVLFNKIKRRPNIKNQII